MLTPEDKKWLETYLDQRFKVERELMREFIIEGRREDRAWVREELTQLRAWTERKIDSSIEQFALIVNAGFVEIHERVDRLEAHRGWN